MGKVVFRGYWIGQVDKQNKGGVVHPMSPPRKKSSLAREIRRLRKRKPVKTLSGKAMGMRAGERAECPTVKMMGAASRSFSGPG